MNAHENADQRTPEQKLWDELEAPQDGQPNDPAASTHRVHRVYQIIRLLGHGRLIDEQLTARPH